MLYEIERYQFHVCPNTGADLHTQFIGREWLAEDTLRELLQTGYTELLRPEREVASMPPIQLPVDGDSSEFYLRTYRDVYNCIRIYLDVDEVTVETFYRLRGETNPRHSKPHCNCPVLQLMSTGHNRDCEVYIHSEANQTARRS